MKPERRSYAMDIDGIEKSERTPLDWPRQSGHLDQLMAAIEVRKQRLRRRRQVISGVVAVMSVVGLSWFSFGRLSHEASGRVVSTKAILLAPQYQTLADGTQVELKPGSNLAVDFSGPLRRVALQRGEAHFQVAKDPERPFVVSAGGVEFRAVGTAFAVHYGSTQVEMIVTEGTVAVERPAASTAAIPPAALATVVAGTQVTLTLTSPAAAPAIAPITGDETSAKLAWRVPQMELNETPLAEAIATINRHSPVALELGDAGLGRLGISGILRADNVEPLLRMLESNYGIHADRSVAGKVTLRPGR